MHDHTFFFKGASIWNIYHRIATFSTCKQISVKAKMKVLYLAGDLMEDFVVGSTLL